MLLCCQKHGLLSTLVVMFRVILHFIHAVLTKQELVPLCLLEIVYTSTHMANFPVCHAYYEIRVVKIFAFKQLYRNYYWCLQVHQINKKFPGLQ